MRLRRVVSSAPRGQGRPGVRSLSGPFILPPFSPPVNRFVSALCLDDPGAGRRRADGGPAQHQPHHPPVGTVDVAEDLVIDVADVSPGRRRAFPRLRGAAQRASYEQLSGQLKAVSGPGAEPGAPVSRETEAHDAALVGAR